MELTQPPMRHGVMQSVRQLRAVRGTDLVEAQYSGDISFLKLDRHHVVSAPNIADVGAAMDATFRFVRAYNQ